MTLLRRALVVGLITLLLGGWLLQPATANTSVHAQTIPTTTSQQASGRPPRFTKITVPYTKNTWWLIRYSNNAIVCAVSAEHEGVPTAEEIRTYCTERIYTEWLETKPCRLADVESYNQCPGFYLQHIGSTNGEREVEIELPLPEVWVTVTNCNARAPDNRCTTLPSLKFTAVEPLPNETIVAIHGSLGGMPFSCMGSTCLVPLKPTGTDGASVEFWADSSFGDSTEHYTARVRLVPWGEFMNPERRSSDPSLWYVDVLSNRWGDGQLPTCSETWQVFPPIGGMPEWLSSPPDSQDLKSDVSYYYLAGSLITYGVVNASGCLDGGLQSPNIASPCGVEAARPQLAEWQNRFDAEILQAARDTGVPARLLKNVFSRESQIWPGIYRTYKEAGLGQLTDNGADTILLWNPDFFRQFCPLVLNKKYCELGFGNLEDPEQNMLRGALVRKVNASCPNCPAGIDLTQANYSVGVFAEGMLANCEQVGRIIRNVTGLEPGQTSGYEDLWRFTLVNYNAGAGCLSDAIESAQIARQPLDWATITSYLQPACQGAIGYVEDITRMLKVTPTPTSWIAAGDLPTPVLPRVINTPTPSGITTLTPTPGSTGTTRTPTPTGDEYPYPADPTEDTQGTPYP